MSIIHMMVEAKNRMVEQEREAAMQALADMIYHRIGPKAVDGKSFPVFGNDEEMDTFCSSFKLNPRALTWVLREMQKEGLITPSPMPVLLSPLGITKLCED